VFWQISGGLESSQYQKGSKKPFLKPFLQLDEENSCLSRINLKKANPAHLVITKKFKKINPK
jgi:hypothetical protein